MFQNAHRSKQLLLEAASVIWPVCEMPSPLVDVSLSCPVTNRVRVMVQPVQHSGHPLHSALLHLALALTLHCFRLPIWLPYLMKRSTNLPTQRVMWSVLNSWALCAVLAWTAIATQSVDASVSKSTMAQKWQGAKANGFEK